MKPILFNAEMVRAILDGRKTTTRQIIKPQPTDQWTKPTYIEADRTWREGWARVIKPPYQPGDVLYVRETWGITGFDPESNEMFVEYKAGGANANIVLPEKKFQKYYEGMSEAEPDWHPSIHMPKEAARIFLRVVRVRPERLQNITPEECTEEGAGVCNTTALFQAIWNSTIRNSDFYKYGWAANPWVWNIEFERIGRETEKTT